MAVQLTINSDANIQGIEKAQRALEQLGMSGKSANQVFKNSGDLEAYKAALQRSYNSAALFNGQVKASQQAITMANAAFKQAQQYLGADPSRTFRFIDEQGVEQQTRDLGIIQKQIFSFLKDVEADTDTFRKAATKNLRSTFSMEGVDKGAEAVRMFGTELEAVEFKMSKIKEQGLHLSSIHGDPKEIQKLSEEYQKLTIEHDKLSKAANGTGERIKNLIKNFVSAQLIVWAIRKVFQLFTQGLKDASAAAAEAEQVMQKFSTVFDRMPQAAESVSDLVAQFGLATVSAQNIMSTIGDMAYGLGASQEEAAAFADTTAKFIQDLVAFKDIGGDVIEITQAFMSGAAGNTRNFRQWGSIVKEANVQARIHEKGLDDLTGSALEWAKAQERVTIVMEQQKNALGATQREWDMMLTINRRLKEQGKELKVQFGQAVNTVLTPIKSGILGIAESWNIALRQANAYRSGLRPVYIESAESTKKILQEFKTVDWGFGIPDMFSQNVTFEKFRAVEQMYNVPWQDLMNIINTHNAGAIGGLFGLQKIDLPQSELEKIREYYAERDRIIASEEARREQGRKRTERESFFSSELAELNDMFLGLGARVYAGQAASKFNSGYNLDSILGFSDQDLQRKIDKLVEDAQTLKNKLITEMQKPVGDQDNGLITIWTDNLGVLESSIRKTYSEQAIGTFNKSLITQVNESKKRNELEKEYGEDRANYVEILMAQWSREQELLELLNLKKITEDQYNKSLSESADYTAWLLDIASERLSLEQQITTQKERQAQEEQAMRAMADFAQGTAELGRANVIARYNLKRSPFDSAAMSAGYDREVARYENKAALYAYANELYTALVGDIGELTGKQMRDYFDAVNERKLALETKAELDYQKALKDARDATLLDIESMWDGLGDIGMVKKWKETFDTMKAYFTSEDGGNMSDKDATAKALGKSWEEVLLEFASRLETVNKLLSMVSQIFDELAPIVDDFLEPFLVVMKPIINMLNVFVPILTLLFPLMQMLAVGVGSVVAWIEFFVNAIRYAIGKLTFWTDSDDISWSEVTGTFMQRLDEVNAIWDMEIDARAEYVSELTDIQKGQLDAYNEMFKSGLLTLTEYNAMVGKNVYGRNFDNVDIASFASGGDFVTSGERIIRVGEAGPEHVTITPLNSTKYANRGNTAISNASYSVTVNGANADPEEIAMSVRREFNRMERRGVRYA